MSLTTRAPVPGSFPCWLLAIRPRTLAVGIAPVLLGTALADSQGAFHLLAAIAALGGALAIQIGTNLVNDYCDARKGADNEERLGPTRVTAAGLLSARAVLAGALLSFAVAVAFGLFLVIHAGWPILIVGVVSILFGVLYTAGPFPLAYLGLGDLFAFFFFGIVATAGTFYVQALEWSRDAILLGNIPGCYSLALIALNNLRDREGDRQAGKKTPAVRFGATFARVEITLALLVPGVIPWLLHEMIPPHFLTFLTLGAVFVALPVLLPLGRGADGRELNLLLGKTGKAALAYCATVAIGLVFL